MYKYYTYIYIYIKLNLFCGSNSCARCKCVDKYI